MDYTTLTTLLASDVPKMCVCCGKRIKGTPRTTHKYNDWRIYCCFCFTECRPVPHRTGCFKRGGKNDRA